MVIQKNKYDRRRALNCKLLRPSKSNKGYYKYEITIGEKDGNVHTEPAYGKDMQDAISRLINIERTNKLENKLNKMWLVNVLLVIMYLVIMVWPAILASTYDSPLFLLFALGGLGFVITLTSMWDKYLNKS